jgi:hypothetical protein
VNVLLLEEMVSALASMLNAKMKESTCIAIKIPTSAELGRTLEVRVKSKTRMSV